MSLGSPDFRRPLFLLYLFVFCIVVPFWLLNRAVCLGTYLRHQSLIEEANFLDRKYEQNIAQQYPESHMSHTIGLVFSDWAYKWDVGYNNAGFRRSSKIFNLEAMAKDLSIQEKINGPLGERVAFSMSWAAHHLWQMVLIMFLWSTLLRIPLRFNNKTKSTLWTNLPKSVVHLTTPSIWSLLTLTSFFLYGVNQF